MKKSSFIVKNLMILFFSIQCIVEADSQIVIQDSVFTSTLDIVGSSWDNAIIKNCTFQNTILSDGLRIANSNNVTIDSCFFYNIQGNGIRLHPSGISDGVIIKNCRFDSIYGNGILADEEHSNTQIVNNTFNWIGLDTESSLQGKPHHGIYFQGNNFLISGNRIQNIFNENGNCVSVRSNGTVRNNILSDATKNGISYYSDHPNVEHVLLVENNIVFNCERGVSISDGGFPYVDSAIIRFNTLVSENLMNISIGSGLTMNIEIYGNIFIRKDGSPIFIWSSSPFDSIKNITSDSDIGFVDFVNHNYHLNNQSIALGFASGLESFPAFDFENDPRTSARLDAGADQYTINTNIKSNSRHHFSVFPNPAANEFFIISNSNEYEILLVDINGKKQYAYKNVDKINISELTSGIYFLKITAYDRVETIKLVICN